MAEHWNMTAIKKCLDPFSPSQALNSNVYAAPEEYVNNSQAVQGIVLAAPVSGSEKLSALQNRILHFLSPPPFNFLTKQHTWHLIIPNEAEPSLSAANLPECVDV